MKSKSRIKKKPEFEKMNLKKTEIKNRDINRNSETGGKPKQRTFGGNEIQ